MAFFLKPSWSFFKKATRWFLWIKMTRTIFKVFPNHSISSNDFKKLQYTISFFEEMKQWRFNDKFNFNIQF